MNVSLVAPVEQGGAPPAPALGSLRERTTAEVYRLIRSGHGEVTRAVLADVTGYPSSTIGHAVAKLIAGGRVVETPVPKVPGAGAGRPAAMLSAVPGQGHTGAIDFGHSHVRVALGDDLGGIIDEAVARINVDIDATEAMKVGCDLLDSLRHRNGTGTLSVVVVGVPGPVDAATGQVKSPTILPGWLEQSPAQTLAERLGVPVVIENDAFLGATAELYRGVGRGFRDFVYVKASDGVGAAIVVDGVVRRGSTGLAGEIGHISIPGRSELCRCGGTGCLEAIISARAVRHTIAVTHPQLDAETVDIGHLNDPVARRVLTENGLVLGRVLADVANLLNPAAIIVGGTMGSSGTAFIDGVRTGIRSRAQPAIAEALVVIPAANGRRAELVGAMALAGLREVL